MTKQTSSWLVDHTGYVSGLLSTCRGPLGRENIAGSFPSHLQPSEEIFKPKYKLVNKFANALKAMLQNIPFTWLVNFIIFQ